MGSASSFMRPSKRNVATTTNATASSNEPMNLTPINAAQQPPSRPPIHPSTANQVSRVCLPRFSRSFDFFSSLDRLHL